jgi:hypothetical protein
MAPTKPPPPPPPPPPNEWMRRGRKNVPGVGSGARRRRRPSARGSEIGRGGGLLAARALVWFGECVLVIMTGLVMSESVTEWGCGQWKTCLARFAAMADLTIDCQRTQGRRISPRAIRSGLGGGGCVWKATSSPDPGRRRRGGGERAVPRVSRAGPIGVWNSGCRKMVRTYTLKQTCLDTFSSQS